MGAVPTTASLAAVRHGLPADPIDATDALVAKVFEPDADTAVAATAEILRRTGLPLVSADRPILALPDTDMIVNHQIPVEMIPSLTDAIRSGQRYTLDQVAQLLDAAGATQSTITGPQLVGLLARWGKSSGDPVESVVAGTAERALGAWHHQLLNPQTVVTADDEQQARANPAHAPAATLAALNDPERVTGLDPLQVILLLAHATSYVDTVADVTASSAPGLRSLGGALLGPVPAQAPGAAAVPAPGAPAPAAAAPSSNALCSFLDFSDTTEGKVGHGVEKNAFRQALIQGAKLVLKTGAAVAKILGKAFVVYDIATDVLTTVLLFTGLHVTISFDKSITHFRHQPHDLSRNVQFVATLTFHSALQGDNGQYHGCWRFAGVSMPQNGGIKNWLVHWKVKGPVVLLRKDNLSLIPVSGPKAVDQPTDANGQTLVSMQPRTELKPPPPGQDNAHPEHMMVNQITADPDPNLDLVEPGDIFNLGAFLVNPLAPVVLELEKMINRAVRNHLLPGTTIPYAVSYHLVEPYTSKADGVLNLIMVAGVHVSADLYSCAGPGGPWKGTVHFDDALQGGMAALKSMLGVGGPDSGTIDKDVSFTLDPSSDQRKSFTLFSGNGSFGMWLQLDPAAIDKLDHPAPNLPAASPVVGTGSWTIGGQDVTELASMLGPSMAHGLTLRVVASPDEPRCPTSTVADDPFDDD
jgi:hypothetical protein